MRNIGYLLMIVLALGIFSCKQDKSGESGGDLIKLTGVQVDVVLNMQWTDYPITRSATLSQSECQRRFIVELWQGGRKLSRQTVIPRDLVPGQTEITLLQGLYLNPQEYTLAVWSDFVKLGSTADLYYDTSDLANVSCREPYTGNTDLRDCYYCKTELDLRPYANQTDSKVPVILDMVRPLAKYRIIATGLGGFRQMVQDDYPGVTEFDIHFSYNFFFPTGFNILENKLSQSREGVVFTGTFTLPADGVDEVELGSDYIFVNGTDTYIPMSMEVFSPDGTKVISRVQGLEVPYQRCYLTTVRGGLLKAFVDSGGIVINPDFDGDIDFDLDRL